MCICCVRESLCVGMWRASVLCVWGLFALRVVVLRMRVLCVSTCCVGECVVCKRVVRHCGAYACVCVRVCCMCVCVGYVIVPMCVYVCVRARMSDRMCLENWNETHSE